MSKLDGIPDSEKYIIDYISDMKQFFDQILYVGGNFWYLRNFGEFSKFYILIFFKHLKKCYLQKIKPKKYFVKYSILYAFFYNRDLHEISCS
jgi:hypothetical protein